MDKNSLAHTTWECKYNIVFAPKYRRKIIYVSDIEGLEKWCDIKTDVASKRLREC